LELSSKSKDFQVDRILIRSITSLGQSRVYFRDRCVVLPEILGRIKVRRASRGSALAFCRHPLFMRFATASRSDLRDRANDLTNEVDNDCGRLSMPRLLKIRIHRSQPISHCVQRCDVRASIFIDIPSLSSFLSLLSACFLPRQLYDHSLPRFHRPTPSRRTH